MTTSKSRELVRYVEVGVVGVAIKNYFAINGYLLKFSRLENDKKTKS